MHHAICLAGQLQVKECVLGMAHRGRLNVLVNIFEKSYEDVFSEFEEHIVPDVSHTGGDVKYHLGKSADITTPEGHEMHLSLVPNPSHLDQFHPFYKGLFMQKNNIAIIMIPVKYYRLSYMVMRQSLVKALTMKLLTFLN